MLIQKKEIIKFAKLLNQRKLSALRSGNISLRYKRKNKFINYVSENFINIILKNLIKKISTRFDKKFIKKVLKGTEIKILNNN